MKPRAGFVTKLAIGALLSSAAWAVPGMRVQAADTMPVKAMESTDPVPYWWFHGEVEAGGRFFLNNPQDHRQTSNAPAGSGTPGTQGNSLAKYYEYSDIRPGVFGNAWLSFGTKDGLWQVDLGGKNIGYNDQAYWLDISKAGQFYFNFGWDQTPHLYSNSAFTPYNLNGNALTLNGCVNPATLSTTSATQVRQLAGCAQPTNIGIRRDTASGDARWTPNDEWDIKVDYSHMTRKGTQVGANSGGTGVTSQITKPVDDTTQNYGLNAEHVGMSPWGQKLIVKLGYIGSTFTENLAGDFFTIQGTPSSSSANANGARQSVWPSNRADGVTGQILADLPWKSRYVGNVSYTMMQQNDSFMPENTNAVQSFALPAASLNGAINTLLINNQLTTKITPELTSKLTYRYYNFQNNTPEIGFTGTCTRDYQGSPPTAAQCNEDPHSLSIAYVKQNAGADLNWRPTKTWNLGVAYGYERYDWTRADVDGTDENMGKVYGDWKPYQWLTVRASGMYGVRTSQNYDYLGHVGRFQWDCPLAPTSGAAPCDNSELYNVTYRQLMIDNRNQGKAQFSVDFVPVHNLTVTPLVKYTEKQYGVDTGQQGLKDSRKWTAGADVVYMFNPYTSIMVGYMYEWGSQLLFGTSCSGTASPNPCGGNPTLTNDTTTVQTFTAGLRYGVIPDKLDTDFRYTASHGVDNMQFYNNGAPPAGGQFPQDRTWFQRFDATATYKFDKEQVARLGWKGDIKAKLRYAWERNAVDNWANDPLTAYTTLTGMNSTLWLAWNNPNYNVHMLSASLVASW